MTLATFIRRHGYEQNTRDMQQLWWARYRPRCLAWHPSTDAEMRRLPSYSSRAVWQNDKHAAAKGGATTMTTAQVIGWLLLAAFCGAWGFVVGVLWAQHGPDDFGDVHSEEY